MKISISNQKKSIMDQVLSIRDSGMVNMLDYRSVKSIADELGFNELSNFINENKKSYSRLIMTGNIDD